MNLLLKSTTPVSKYSRNLEDEVPEITLSPEIKSIIRRKVSSYLHSSVNVPPQQSKQNISHKKNKQPLPRDYPEYENLNDLCESEEATIYLFKQKIDRNLDEAEYCKCPLI